MAKTEYFTYFCAVKCSVYKICIIIAAALVFPTHSSAQYVFWNVGFDFRFDNREYGNPSRMIAPSETIFGAKLIPEIGVEWDRGHSVVSGAVLPATFGAQDFMGTPEWMVYYHYDGKEFCAFAGKFPRHKMIGSYSAAFISDKVLFEDRILEGMLLQYTTDYTSCELGCDWNGHNTSTQREKFVVFSSGQVGWQFLRAGYALTLHHHAGSYTVRGVVDNVLGGAWLEVNLAEVLDWKSAYIRGTWLKAYQNDRKHVGIPVLPQGFELDAKVQVSNVGVRATLYRGGDLMPYYDSPYENADGAPYADNLYHGDIFYHSAGDDRHALYGRAEFFWEPEIIKGLNLRLSSVHHWDGKNFGWQQVVSLTTYFESN